MPLIYAATVAESWIRNGLEVASGQTPTPTKSLGGLRPSIRSKAAAFLAACASAGHPLRVDETFRTTLRQESVGKTAGIAAKPGQSRHEAGVAFDVWPVGFDYSSPLVAGLLDQLARDYAAPLGLKNLGSIGDHVHFEES